MPSPSLSVKSPRKEATQRLEAVGLMLPEFADRVKPAINSKKAPLDLHLPAGMLVSDLRAIAKILLPRLTYSRKRTESMPLLRLTRLSLNCFSVRIPR